MSVARIASADTGAIATLLGADLNRLSSRVRDFRYTLDRWFNSAPGPIRGDKARFQAVAFHQLMRRFDLGGDSWVSRFIFGFPTTGALSQEGVSPSSDKTRPPITVSSIWNSSVKRFNERARASGYRNIDSIWKEAISQVQEDWWGEPAESPPRRRHRTLPGRGDRRRPPHRRISGWETKGARRPMS